MLRTNDTENKQSSSHSTPQSGGAEPWGKLTLMSRKATPTPASIVLIEDEVVIGRKTIDSTLVSKKHATIRRLVDSGCWITDHSSNGTAINGVRIKEGELKNGDFVVFCGCCNVDVGRSMLVEKKDRSSFRSVSSWNEFVRKNASGYYVYKFETSAEGVVNTNKRTNEDREESVAVPNPSKKKKIEEPPSFALFQRECIHLLECPICESVFVDPIGLECGHTFCKDCFYKKLDKDLGKDLVCFSCEKKILSAPRPSTQLAMLVRLYSETDMPRSEVKERNEKTAKIKTRHIADLTEFKSNNPHIQLSIRKEWSQEQREAFKRTSRHCTGECKRYYLDAIGLTEALIDNCSGKQVETAIDNLSIAALCTTGDKQEKKLDVEPARDKLAQFQSSFDALFI